MADACSSLPGDRARHHRPDATSVIRTEALVKDYGSLRAVDHVSIHVRQGELFGFLGPNGSGKTTTILLLLGVLRPTSGRVTLLGRSGLPDLRSARRRVGATVELPCFYDFLSGTENLTLVAHAKGIDASSTESALNSVGLSERAGDRVGTYSLGMKQRLALAAAILGDPELIILDEPTNGLDPSGIREIRELILALHNRGKTIFLSSHRLSEVQRLCTQVGIISEGRLAYSGPLGHLQKKGEATAVEVSGSGNLAELLEVCPIVRSYDRMEDGFLLQLERGDAAELNRFLVSRGARVHRLLPRTSDLEDIFFDIVGDAREKAEDP